MTLPNKLTMLRIALVPVFVLFALLPGTVPAVLALAVFAAASITDTIDGWIAHKYNLITVFGKIMDPLADKLLVLAAFVIFAFQGRIHAVTVLIIIFRELLVTALRTLAMHEGTILAAAKSGKIKTTVQMIVIVALLLRPEMYFTWGGTVCAALGWVTAAVTLISGIDYFIVNRAVVRSSMTQKP